MKNEGFVYPAKLMNTDQNISLKQTLYALDHERRFKMRELDTKKKQFLHEHRMAVSRRNGQHRQPVNTRDMIQEKIERKIEEEKRSALDLQSRSADFIQELRVKPLSVLTKMEKKHFPLEEEKTPTIESVTAETLKPSLNNKVLSLYQKGLAGVLQREREKRVSPFMQSVNNILDNLRNDKGNKRDPMSCFTRNILSKYAHLDTGGAEPISEESEIFSDNVSPENESPDNNKEKNVTTVEQNGEADADEYLETSKHSSKGLQLWARVRKEQNSISFKRDNQDGFDMTKSNTGDTSSKELINKKASGRPVLNLNISKCRASPSKGTLSSPTQQRHATSPTSPRTPKMNRALSPRGESLNSGERKGSKTPPTNNSLQSMAKSTSPIGASRKSFKAKEFKTASNGKPKAIPKLAVEDVDQDEQSHHTVVVVHEDDDNGLQTPIQWDQSHRYSLNDTLGTDELEYLKTLDKSNRSVQGSAPSDETRRDTLAVNYNNEKKIVDDEDDASPETPTGEREELQSSTLSVTSESRLTTSAGTGTRSHSRQGGRKSRRLSVQTSGALRALSSVLNMQDKHVDSLKDDASSYENVVNALADLSNSVEEQAKKLDNVRRAGPALVGRESNTGSSNRKKEGANCKMGRSSVGFSDRRSSSFVTNEVYKFLERRTSSKTMARRQTLSKLELRLLSQAPGEDVVGRRNSFSTTSFSQRGSVDFPSSSASSVTGSINGSLADITSNLLDLDRQKISRRHSLSAVPERVNTASPLSASRLSNISESGSLNGSPDAGKTLRSYSWAPDVSETTDGHVLAMELLARNNRSGASGFRTVTHMLKWLGEEYRRQTASMMYEELRYCTYLRLTPYQIPDALKDSNVSGVFHSET